MDVALSKFPQVMKRFCFDSGALWDQGGKCREMAGMRRSHIRLLGMAFLAGAGFRLGIPGLAEVIAGLWGEFEPASRGVLPHEWQGLIGVISILILGIVLYLNYEIFLKGAKKGRRGLLITVCGFCAGVLVVSYLVLPIFG